MGKTIKKINDKMIGKYFLCKWSWIILVLGANLYGLAASVLRRDRSERARDLFLG